MFANLSFLDHDLSDDEINPTTKKNQTNISKCANLNENTKGNIQSKPCIASQIEELDFSFNSNESFDTCDLPYKLANELNVSIGMGELSTNLYSKTIYL